MRLVDMKTFLHLTAKLDDELYSEIDPSLLDMFDSRNKDKPANQRASAQYNDQSDEGNNDDSAYDTSNDEATDEREERGFTDKIIDSAHADAHR